LLDTSALLRFWLGRESLRSDRLDLIENPANIIYVSPISAMEIATKHRIGKLPGVENILMNFDAGAEADGFAELPLRYAHALLAGKIPGEHRDPFDRLLAAQTIIEDMTIISPDAAFDALGARRLW
jgi:PIN domain nuclease of toxin-antitoxin system